MNRVMFRDWHPHLLYNHHQSGPAGTVVYSPPLRDPYNFNLHPALILGLQSLSESRSSGRSSDVGIAVGRSQQRLFQPPLAPFNQSSTTAPPQKLIASTGHSGASFAAK